MCSPKAPALVTRGFADVMTFGSYESVRHIPGPIGSIPQGAEALVDKTTGGPGSPSYIPGFDKAPQSSGSSGGSADTPNDAGPEPTPSAPTESAAMLAKRRALLQRMGLLSTITTGGQGLTTAPNILTPSASAGTGVKTALGQ